MFDYDNYRGVAVVTFASPGTLNGLSLADAHRLNELLDLALSDEDVKALVLQGRDGAFCIGISAAYLSELCEQPFDLRRAAVQVYQKAVRRVLEAEIVTIAHLNGFAAGMGAELALGCDRIYATDDARIRLFYSSLGLVPDMGLVSLRAALGRAGAVEAYLSTDGWDKDALVSRGLAVPLEEKLSSPKDWHRELRKEIRVPRPALVRFKRSLARTDRAVHDDLVAELSEAQAELMGTEEFKSLFERVFALQRLSISSRS